VGKQIFYIVVLLSAVFATFSCRQGNSQYPDNVGFDSGQRSVVVPVYVPRPTSSAPRPYSGAYSNPYNMPPQQYQQYYDYDQYYVPPAGYGIGGDAISKY
jgi:hypothetical protein